MGTLSRSVLAIGLLVGMGGWQAPPAQHADAPREAGAGAPYRSPQALVISSDGKTAYVCDKTTANITELDLPSGAKRGEILLHGQPHGLCLSPDGRWLYVAERGAGTVACIDTATRTVSQRITVDRWPVAVALAPKSQRLYVAAQDTHRVWVIDVSASTAAVVTHVPVVREPNYLTVTPDERHVVVTNLLPDGASSKPDLSAVVSLIDAASAATQARHVSLPPGSSSLRGVCTSPDGKWAYVVHGLGRFNLPITQLERGWVNTYALSIIEITSGSRQATLLLDDLTQGAANPYEVVCAPDGQRLWISHAGVHEVSLVEIGKIHDLLQGRVPANLADLKDGMQPNVWVRIQQDRQIISELENDLTALYIAGAIRRVESGGQGPRGLALAPDGKTLYVANYYSGSIAVLDAQQGSLLDTISLGSQPDADGARRGEMLFHDATRCFQRWHSCASCHPNDARTDALRWDFLRDGIGNGKDTISLIGVGHTEPLNRRATRNTVLECARTGFTGGHLRVPTEEEVNDMHAFLLSLEAEASPHLKDDGTLTEAAQRGKTVFFEKAACGHCHPAPYYTDKKLHDVGTRSATDPDGRYDTPSLLEAHRTAPYLHDGRARSLEDVLTEHNSNDRHGKIRGLTADELSDLIAFLRSL